jgi:hypothetical protein
MLWMAYMVYSAEYAVDFIVVTNFKFAVADNELLSRPNKTLLRADELSRMFQVIANCRSMPSSWA